MTESENPMRPPGAPLDPFAVDFFGGAPPADDRQPVSENAPKPEKPAENRKKSDWHKNLPRITNREAEFSNLLSNLPENLTESAAQIIARTLARYTFQPSEAVECKLVSVAEVNLNRAIQEETEAPKIILTIGGQTANARAVAAFNFDLAGSLIDSMLDGQGAETANRRDLSPVETTIVEFLAANILGEINNFLGEKLLFLLNTKARTPDFFEPFERGAQIVLSIVSGETRGVISVFTPARFLKSLDKTSNPIFTKKTDARKLSDFEKFARRLDLRLQIGVTRLAADSLLYLERDDVVLIEEPQIALENGNFGGTLQVFVGRGANFRLRGSAANDDSGGGLQIKIEEILSEEARRKFTPAKFKMDVNENDLAEEKAFENETPGAEKSVGAADEQISPSLENIQVGLRVEIAGDKISLRELQNLRAGQIIALGVSPTDPVRLVADQTDEPVAAGELVEIEGQLGVRLTKIFI